MNREGKRNFTQQLKAKGYSKQEIEQMIKIKEVLEQKKNLQEGQKVKLNLERITSQPDYTSLTEPYRKWVESHGDTVFTVERDPKYQDDPTLVCLTEDDSSPKWLFWEGDLKVIS